MNIMFWSKVGTLWLLSLSITIIATFLWTGNKKDQEWENKIKAAPHKIDTVKFKGILPAPPPVIKWLKPEKVFEASPEIVRYIDSLTNDCTRLKALLVEKAKPWETKMDSTRFYLHIFTHPWTRENLVTIRIKPFEYDALRITDRSIVLEERPWWELPAAIVGAGLAGYGIARINH